MYSFSYLKFHSLFWFSFKISFFLYAAVAAGEESELLVGMKNEGNDLLSASVISFLLSYWDFCLISPL